MDYSAISREMAPSARIGIGLRLKPTQFNRFGEPAHQHLIERRFGHLLLLDRLLQLDAKICARGEFDVQAGGDAGNGALDGPEVGGYEAVEPPVVAQNVMQKRDILEGEGAVHAG